VDLTAAKTFETFSASRLPVGNNGVLLAVCDGVGGRRAGEVASALALEALSHEMEDLTGGCPREGLFQQAVENVNRRVWEEGRLDPVLEGMATTLTAAVVCAGRVIVAHVGDSRLYFLRGGRIRQVTRDQSFLAEMLAAGALTQEEAAASPYRNVLSQAIGRKKRVEVALDGVDLLKGDLLLLCTDGLSEKVSPEEMARLVQKETLPEAGDRLVALANERGGEDNITVLIGRIEAEQEKERT